MSPIAEQEMLTFEKGPLEIKTANKEVCAEEETAKKVPELDYAYFEISQNIPYRELTDEEVLTLADKAGTFDFLNAPEEDIYNPSDGTPI